MVFINERQKEVLKWHFKSEKEVLKELERLYQDALSEIEHNMQGFILRLMYDEADTSAVYRYKYQETLKKLIEDIIKKLQEKQYETIEQYLQDSYEDGFLGTLYDLQGQGVPLAFPISENQVVKAILHDTKLSVRLYDRLELDIDKLKRLISTELTRGIAQNQHYSEIAKKIHKNAGVTRRKAMVIARTEGHRINEQAREDLREKAKKAGADIVKQWDSTLDSRTRPTHVKLNGQIRELDEFFEVDGKKALKPSHFGIASEDINCRCITLQRARWALELEKEYTKWSDFEGKLVTFKSTTYEDFKEEYQQIEFIFK